MVFSNSKALFHKYADVVGSGMHSNARVFWDFPIYFREAEGSRIWDVDGNEYIDCVAGFGSCLLGYNDPSINKAVKETIDKGLTATLETELSLSTAKQLKQMIPSADQVRFANTGTEAIMKALMTVRGFTGKEKIVKLEGGYNGWYEDMLVSYKPPLEAAGSSSSPIPVVTSKGIKSSSIQSIIPIPFNDSESSLSIIQRHKDEIAAVIMEPIMSNIGWVEPKEGYIESIREVTRKNSIPLIFDEVVTGFRVAPGGAQEKYGIVPDLSVFAKSIANGYPLSALVGRDDLMQVTAPGGSVFYGGTYNAHQIALAAASVCLHRIRTESVLKHLEKLTQQLKAEFNSIAKRLHSTAKMHGGGGKFQIYFAEHEIVDYRSAAKADKDRYRRFQRAVLENGVLMSPNIFFHHGITAAHREDDINKILAVMGQALKQCL